MVKRICRRIAGRFCEALARRALAAQDMVRARAWFARAEKFFRH